MHSISILGRPNVGKSTLFNRLIEERKAIVNSTPGVTRDINHGLLEWRDVNYLVYDTGGYTSLNEDSYAEMIRRNALELIENGDFIVFLLDYDEPYNPDDDLLFSFIRKSDKPYAIVINKGERYQGHAFPADFYRFDSGLGNLFHISAESGYGTGELLDYVYQFFPNKQTATKREEPLFALVGRPNAGKSSIVNATLAQEIALVSDQPGTTRDAILYSCAVDEYTFELYDTSGLRRKSKTRTDVEYYSDLRTIQAIQKADVVVLVIDISAFITSQDIQIFSLAVKHNSGVVIVANKWDLVPAHHKTPASLYDKIRNELSPFSDVPIVTTNAVSGKRVQQIFREALAVYNRMHHIYSTKMLNDQILPVIKQTPPPSYRGSSPSIKFIQQVSASIPTFLLFTNYPKAIASSYKRFVENTLRSHLDLTGTPINVFFRQS